ncbi:hypothetical protein [Gordonia sp. FQ]|uniref:hypothetical protein n=1 Tax=Gordonia sp. FQ TaxID=3446634 RepID=UPI003F87C61E
MGPGKLKIPGRSWFFPLIPDDPFQGGIFDPPWRTKPPVHKPSEAEELLKRLEEILNQDFTSLTNEEFIKWWARANSLAATLEQYLDDHGDEIDPKLSQQLRDTWEDVHRHIDDEWYKRYGALKPRYPTPTTPTPPGDKPDPKLDPGDDPDPHLQPGDDPDPDLQPGDEPPSEYPPTEEPPQVPGDTPDTIPDTPRDPVPNDEVPGDGSGHDQPTDPLPREPAPEFPDETRPPEVTPRGDTPAPQRPEPPAGEPGEQPDRPPAEGADPSIFDGVASWLTGIVMNAEPPPGDGPTSEPGRGSLLTQGAIIVKLIEIIDDLADDMRGDEEWRKATPQAWGTELHKRLEHYLKEYLELQDLIEKSGFALKIEESLQRGEEIERDQNGKIVWAPRGQNGTVRPDVIITQVIDGDETIAMVLDLKTGKARISRAWKEAIGELIGKSGEQLDSIVRPIRPTNPKRADRFIEITEEDFPWD